MIRESSGRRTKWQSASGALQACCGCSTLTQLRSSALITASRLPSGVRNTSSPPWFRMVASPPS